MTECIDNTALLPTDRDAFYHFTPLQRGDLITLDDDHLLWLVKDLPTGER